MAQENHWRVCWRSVNTFCIAWGISQGTDHDFTAAQTMRGVQIGQAGLLKHFLRFHHLQRPHGQSGTINTLIHISNPSNLWFSRCPYHIRWEIPSSLYNQEKINLWYMAFEHKRIALRPGHSRHMADGLTGWTCGGCLCAMQSTGSDPCSKSSFSVMLSSDGWRRG